MGCYLLESHLRFGTWAGIFSWRGLSRRGEANGTAGDCLGLTVLISVVLVVLLMIGGIEKNLCPIVEVENTVRLLYTRYGKNPKSGTQCEFCAR